MRADRGKDNPIVKLRPALPAGRLLARAPTILIATCLVSLGASAGRASQSAGCETINREALSLGVEPGQVAARTIALAAGERLEFSVGGEAGGAVAIALVQGPGAPQTLRPAQGPSRFGFAAPAAGAYGFELRAGDGSASISVACLTALESTDAGQPFLTRRAQLLAAQEPDRIRLDRKAPEAIAPGNPVPGVLDIDEEGRLKRAQLSVSLADIAAASHPGNKRTAPGILDFWLEGHLENYEAETSGRAPADGTLGVVYLGTKFLLNPDIMVGALAQFDHAGEGHAASQADLAASGWLAGPYVSMRLAPGVVLDGRAAWGHFQSVAGIEGESAPQGERTLVRGKLTGTRDVGGWKLAPSVGFSYLDEGVAGASLDGASEAQSGTLGRVDVLPEVSRRFSVNSDTYIEPRFAVGTFWNFDDISKAAASAGEAHTKLEAGVAVGVKDGTSLRATGNVESGGADAADTWSGRLQLNVPLNK